METPSSLKQEERLAFVVKVQLDSTASIAVPIGHPRWKPETAHFIWTGGPRILFYAILLPYNLSHFQTIQAAPEIELGMIDLGIRRRAAQMFWQEQLSTHLNKVGVVLPGSILTRGVEIVSESIVHSLRGQGGLPPELTMESDLLLPETTDRQWLEFRTENPGISSTERTSSGLPEK